MNGAIHLYRVRIADNQSCGDALAGVILHQFPAGDCFVFLFARILR